MPPQLPLFTHEGDSDSEPSTPIAATLNPDETSSTPSMRLNKFKLPTGSALSNTPKVVISIFLLIIQKCRLLPGGKIWSNGCIINFSAVKIFLDENFSDIGSEKYTEYSEVQEVIIIIE